LRQICNIAYKVARLGIAMAFAADASFCRGRLTGRGPPEVDPIEVVMAPAEQSRTSIGRWAVQGSNLRPWD
jgi:hypothetical protein